jgi:predicted TIM-barrel fold metal-dependent hydrolase
VANKVCKFLPHPAFEVVAKPGIMDQYFRAKTSADDIRTAMGELEPCPVEYRDRDKRLAVMDRQGLQAAFFYPTLGVGIEELLRDDPEACAASFESFNKWVSEDWGYDYQNRIFGVPYIPLGDPDRAVQLLEQALAGGARAFVMRAAPVTTYHGESHGPADPRLDRFWSLVSESGILATIHSGDSGYGRYVNDWQGFSHMEAFRQNPFAGVILADRAIMDCVASMLCDGLFLRFPKIRLATIEAGSQWVPELFRRLKKSFAQMPKAFSGVNPIETFKQNIWVSPFFEDDIVGLVESIGHEHVLFGSDWPHVEGLAEPTEYIHDLKGLPDDQVRDIMRDNAFELIGVAA